jgi:hypothetical protein
MGFEGRRTHPFDPDLLLVNGSYAVAGSNQHFLLPTKERSGGMYLLQ